MYVFASPDILGENGIRSVPTENDQAECRMSGWLEHSSYKAKYRFTNKSKGKRTKWSRRYFELRDRFLIFFKVLPTSPHMPIRRRYFGPQTCTPQPKAPSLLCGVESTSPCFCDYDRSHTEATSSMPHACDSSNAIETEIIVSLVPLATYQEKGGKYEGSI